MIRESRALSVLLDDLSSLSNADLDDALTELCAHMNAAEHELVRLVGEWESRGLRGSYGVRSVAEWLSYKCGIDLGAAREKVRVAKALRDLPVLAQSFAKGEVSYSKIRAVTRVATPDNESLLLSYAKGGTAAHIEKVVRGYRHLERVTDPERILRQRRARGLRWHHDDDGMLVIRGRFPPEEGALILKALEIVQGGMYRDERAQDSDELMERCLGRTESDCDEPRAARHADALVQLIEAGAAGDAELCGGERTMVVLHVPVPDGSTAGASSATDAAAHGPPELEDGPVVAPDTARRLACDASRVVHVEDAEGTVVSIGRRSRTVPHWMRRALDRRDRGCRFPGCSRTRHVDAHHVRHWADGGETSLDNLVLLCRHHHRLIHEEGFDCEVDARGAFVFRAPDGERLPEAFRLPRGGVDSLAALNRRRGLAITPRTCSGGWDGRRVDFSEAISAIWYRTHGTHALPTRPPREGRSRSGVMAG